MGRERREWGNARSTVRGGKGDEAGVGEIVIEKHRGIVRRWESQGIGAQTCEREVSTRSGLRMGKRG